MDIENDFIYTDVQQFPENIKLDEWRENQIIFINRVINYINGFDNQFDISE